MNNVLTISEFKQTKLACVDNVIYNNIEARFRKLLGNKATKFLEQHWDYTVSELSTNNFVNIMDCFIIIGE